MIVSSKFITVCALNTQLWGTDSSYKTLYVIFDHEASSQCDWLDWPVLLLPDELIETTKKSLYFLMKKIQITSAPDTLKLHDKIYVPACCRGGLLHRVMVYVPRQRKSMPCMIDILNVKEARVAIHQVFSPHACFCSIIWSRGKDSDASSKQTSQELICEMHAGGDKDGGLMEGNKGMQAEIKIDSPQGSFPLHFREVALKWTN